jgi:GNAT superfamily N-acetyltransferase
MVNHYCDLNGYRPMTIEFRKATTKDIAPLQALARRVIDTSYRPFLGDAGVDQFMASGAADSYVSENISDCVLICVDGEIAGFASCKAELIDLMMIAQHAHRSGLGSQLLEHCEALLFEQFEQIKLESFEGNIQANNFYQKHNWNLTQRLADPDSGINKYLFIKRRSTSDKTDNKP